MTPEEFAAKMREIAARTYAHEDTTHMEAEDIIITLLTLLGYGEGARVFDKMSKWYS